MPRWTAARLKALLAGAFDGERVLVLANREPCRHDLLPDGRVAATRTASGLVTAVEPVVQACGGVWIAHGAGTADRLVVDHHDHVGVPEGNPDYCIRRLWLPDDEYAGYYGGFANEGLWPLCHDVGVPAVFRPADFRHYQSANARFARAAIEEGDTPAPLVLVHDYHLALTPRLIRRGLPNGTIVTFWHIPWPGRRQMARCPSAGEIMAGLLGSDILGFQTQLDCERFIDSVSLIAGASVDASDVSVTLGGRRTLLRVYPIAIEYPSRWVRPTPPRQVCRDRVRRRIGAAADAQLVLGVDRLDYTKGIVEKCLAMERLLESAPEYRGRLVMAQIAEPSREALPAYREARAQVVAAVARINARFGAGAYQPIVLREWHHEPAEVFEFMRAADVCHVGSLRDGMNLVAKEFVAARTDGRGVLLLSQHAGAAEQLHGALLIDPRQVGATAVTLAAALAMPVPEQARRLAAMRACVADANLYWWAGQMLHDAADLRDARRRPPSATAETRAGQWLSA